MRHINLKKTRLTQVTLSNSCLDAVHGYNLYLDKSILTDCSIYQGDFEKAIISNSNISRTEFTNSSFKHCQFDDVLMEQSVFLECDFSGSNFIEINVEKAVFNNSNLCHLENPEEVDVVGKPKSVKGAIIDRYTLLMLKDSDFKEALNKEARVLNDKFDKEYDVALSFAGEQRDYVEKVAKYLKDKKIRVFYDFYETHTLWGKELISHLTELYSEKCSYVIVFASEDYANKGWTNVERVAFLSRILLGEYDRILTVKMDDTQIKGLTNSKAHLESKFFSPEKIGEIFVKRMIEELK